MKPPPAGQNGARAQRGRWRHLARWPRARKLGITVTYRGGAESWWLIQARGSQGVFPGHAALEDVMARVLNEPVMVADQPPSRSWSEDAHVARAAAHRVDEAFGPDLAR